MAETFLEEQLKRIRELTEQMSRVRPLHDMHERHGITRRTPTRSSSHERQRRAATLLATRPRRRGR